MKIKLGSLIKATIFGGAILVLVDVFTIYLGFIWILASWAASTLVGWLYVRYHRQKGPVSASQGALGGGLSGVFAVLAAGMVGAGVGLLGASMRGTSPAPIAGTVFLILHGGFIIGNAVAAAVAGALMASRNPKKQNVNTPPSAF